MQHPRACPSNQQGQRDRRKTLATTAIRDTIALALQHEAKTSHLAIQLKAHMLDRVHMAIQLPEGNAVGSIVDFIIAYIEHVPSFLEAAWDITESAGIRSYATPILSLAESYFLKPPEIVNGHIGLDELMDEAYLAHRLLDEVNDRFMVRAGIPLVPMDMTISNLIVHNLIGEPFSNELDDAVQIAAGRLMNREQVYESNEFKDYVATHRGDQWQAELERWPCLTDQLSINLQLPG